MRNIGTLNPFSRATWSAFSLNVHGADFLKDFFEASRDAGLKPFLMWGTLLGCVREGSLLPHDNDIDIGLLAADWPKRDALALQMQKRGYDLGFVHNYRLRFIRRDKITHLDVDVFFPWEGKMVCFYARGDGTYLGALFPPDAFDRFREVTFLNAEVSIPDPPERILETVYGDWRTPVRSHRSTDIPNRLRLADGASRPTLPEPGP